MFPVVLASLRVAAIAGLCTAASVAQAASLQLSCELRPERKAEAKMIAQKAAGVVKRSKKQLTITAGGRSIVMSDVPSDDPMDGTYYYFCDRKDGYILISVFDAFESKGSLIEEASGQVMPGGVPTVMSDDRKRYLVSTHNSGAESDDWTVYGEKGKLWSGTAGLLTKDESGIVATFMHPVFDAQGKLTARAECYNDPSRNWPITLEQKGKKWAWTPVKKC